MKVLKSITTLILTALLATNLVFATESKKEPEAKLFVSSNAKLYIAQGLLKDSKKWDEAYELIRDVLKNDNDLNPIVRSKVADAASIMRWHNWKTKVTSWWNGTQYKKRPYIEAQLLLAEALMDSRIELNQSNDSEALFVEKLLKNYFYPGNAEKVTITYPSASLYAFNKWALTKEALAELKVPTSSEEDAPAPAAVPQGIPGIKANATDSARLPGFGGFANIFPPNFGMGIFPPAAVAPRTVGIDGQKKLPLLLQNLVASDTTEVTINDHKVTITDEDKSLIGDLISVESLESGLQVYEEVKKIADNINLVKTRVTNRYLQEAMLLQALVEPGSAIIDPQMQAFLKGVRIEYQVAQVDMPTIKELYALNDAAGEKIVKREGNSLTIDLAKLYKLNRDETYSALKIRLDQVQDETDKAIMYVISSISGEDLMFNKILQQAAFFLQKATVVEATTASAGSVANAAAATTVSINNSSKVYGWMLALSAWGEALEKTIKVGKDIDRLSKFGKSVNSFKHLAVALTKGSVSPAVIFQKLEKSSFVQKLLGYTINSEYVKSGRFLKTMIAVGLAMELTVGMIDATNAKTVDDKLKIQTEMFARCGASILYLYPAIGQVAATVDIIHLVTGFPLETASLFRGVGYGAKRYAMWQYGFTPTTYEMIDLETKYNLPRNDAFILKHTVKLEDAREIPQRKIKMLEELADISLSYMTMIYRSHRTFAKSSNYDYGEKLGEHIDAYESNLSAFDSGLKKLDAILKQVSILNLPSIDSDLGIRPIK